MKEGTAITQSKTGLAPPMFLRLLRPWVVRALFALGERVLPLDLETYMRVHFTKVKSQTRLHLTSQVEHGKQAGLPTAALETLLLRTAPEVQSAAG